MLRILLLTPFVLVAAAVLPVAAQEELPPEETVFHTFSIAAVDPETGESGVAVTTRNPCVANGVPWVRVGVGAVATQARTRTQYGEELLSRLAAGMSAEDALTERLAEDEGAPYRQVGVVGLAGGVAQHTGPRRATGRDTGPGRTTRRKGTCSSVPRWWTRWPTTSRVRAEADCPWRTA